MSSLFVIVILFISIITTTSFDNAILIASVHNFPNSVYFQENFGTPFQKGSIYFCAKNLLPLLLDFRHYNPFPNWQIVSLIDAKTHLELQLLRHYLQPHKLKKKWKLNPEY